MVEASENLVTKKQKENAQDLRYENGRKVKKKTSNAWFKLLYW